MNNVEDRLLAAGEETRRLARQIPIARFVEGVRTRHNGMLILASAFAGVLVIFGLLPWLMSEPRGAIPTDNTPGTPAETVTTGATTMTTTPQKSCSSQGVTPPREVEGLPTPVASTRDAIVTAATACDFEALEDLAVDDFTSSFGGGGVENLELWEDQGQTPMATLLHLFDMNHAAVPVEGGEIYVWPASATYESWQETVSEEELEELTRIHTEEELDQFASAGGYLGWRTAIDQEGNWLYFGAGD